MPPITQVPPGTNYAIRRDLPLDERTKNVTSSVVLHPCAQMLKRDFPRNTSLRFKFEFWLVHFGQPVTNAGEHHPA